MELYIGGEAQGKLAYVLETKKMKKEAVCHLGEDFGCEANWNNYQIFDCFHEYIRRCYEQQIDVFMMVEQLKKRMQETIIICNEVGAGIVPMKREEREYRELVGRVCCELAKHATRVERIVCGIGVRIK